MQIGFIGLGRMGKAMVEHLLEEGVDVVVYNRSREKTEELKSKFQNPKSQANPKSQIHIKNSGQLVDTYDVKELVNKLTPPRIVWLMVPHGEPVDEMIEKLLGSPEVSREVHLGGVREQVPSRLPPTVPVPDSR